MPPTSHSSPRQFSHSSLQVPSCPLPYASARFQQVLPLRMKKQKSPSPAKRRPFLPTVKHVWTPQSEVFTRTPSKLEELRHLHPLALPVENQFNGEVPDGASSTQAIHYHRKPSFLCTEVIPWPCGATRGNVVWNSCESLLHK